MFICINEHSMIIHWHNAGLAFSTYSSFTITIVSVDQHQRTIPKEIYHKMIFQ